MLFLVQGANKLCANANVSLMSKFCTILPNLGLQKMVRRIFLPTSSLLYLAHATLW